MAASAWLDRPGRADFRSKSPQYLRLGRFRATRFCVSFGVAAQGGHVGRKRDMGMKSVMDRRAALKGFATLGFCAICAKTGFAAQDSEPDSHGAPHWSYEGATGPANWGDLDAADKVCAIGSQQSPIAIEGSIPAELPPLKLDWKRQADAIVNNGHTIQLNFDDGGALKVGPDSYKLVQFHFHHPSEHLIDGKPAAMEIHFVHRNEAGKLAVIGVLVKPGKPNSAFAKIIAAAPASAGEPVKAPGADPRGLLPKSRGYYYYSGSLTTPPCSETVEWIVLKQPIEVAESDIAAFAKLYPMNARPVQQIDRRFVLRTP
jgi:carbonic anhydrase